mgnify:CR=1 FL=1
MVFWPPRGVPETMKIKQNPCSVARKQGLAWIENWPSAVDFVSHFGSPWCTGLLSWGSNPDSRAGFWRLDLDLQFRCNEITNQLPCQNDVTGEFDRTSFLDAVAASFTPFDSKVCANLTSFPAFFLARLFHFFTRARPPRLLPPLSSFFCRRSRTPYFRMLRCDFNCLGFLLKVLT